MCGRYVLMDDETGIGARFFYWQDLSRAQWDQLLQDGKVLPVQKSYNIAPTQRVPVITNRDGERRLEMARWALVPVWWKDEKLPPSTFNARDDNMEKSGMWRRLLNRNRCLVPANGFYEWSRKQKTRVPYYIHRKDNALYAFAGLFDRWQQPDTGEWMTSVTIITTAPNKLIEPLHDRAPLILPDPEVESVWIDPMTGFEGVQRHVVPTEWEDMTMHEVSTDVNSTRPGSYVNEPRLIAEVQQASWRDRGSEVRGLRRRGSTCMRHGPVSLSSTRHPRR